MDASLSIDDRVAHLITEMTIEEKIAQLGSFWVYEILDGITFVPEKAHELMPHGIGQITRVGGASSVNPRQSAELTNTIQRWIQYNTRLKIPAVVHEECCSGYMAQGATVFPQAIGIASTWDPQLCEAMGEVIRRQMRSVGGHHALAPVLDVTRDARWGRVEETFGEDPYLVSRMGGAYIKGLQGDDWQTGIIATGKHFVGYGTTEGGMNWSPAHIPERELREVYLYPFEVAIKEFGLASIMNAYHELDGVPCGANRKLLNTILREEWGFDGTVVSDYFAVKMLFDYHHVAVDRADAAKVALEAGIDVELPGTDCYGAPLKEAIEKGDVRESLIDTVVSRVLHQKFQLGIFDNPYVEEDAIQFDTDADRTLARELAQKSIVLLKNEDNLLPLKKDVGSIAVIGPNADKVRNLFGDYAYPAHMETLMEMKKNNPMGMTLPEMDFSADDFIPAISILQGIKDAVSKDTQITYAEGCDIISNRTDGFDEAVDLAKAADVVIMVMGDKAGLTDGCTSGEACDRATLDLPGVQEQLIKAIYKTGKPIVLALLTGRPVTLNWIADDVPAIVEAWFPSEEGASAIADVLFGDINPGGKLPMTFPRTVGQVPIFYGHRPSGGRSQWKINYVETPSSPLYPFGYGLSYTQFEFSDLQIETPQVQAADTVVIKATVKNTGTRAGDEVVQLYTHTTRANVTRPLKELKGFKRITLQPNETRTVVFELPVNALAYYDVDMRYVVTPGTIEVIVGNSSVNQPLTGSFNIIGDETEIM